VFVGSVGCAAVAQRIGAVLTRGTSVIELARPAAQLGERVSALPPDRDQIARIAEGPSRVTNGRTLHLSEPVHQHGILGWGCAARLSRD
jgi:hypothetical protein